jgi:hypothetical protein
LIDSNLSIFPSSDLIESNTSNIAVQVEGSTHRDKRDAVVVAEAASPLWVLADDVLL